MEQIAKEQGIKWTHVPFRGTSDSTNALLGGHINLVADASGWAPLVNSGKLRLLVIWSDKRSKSWPDVPTLKEAGIAMVSNSPFGLAGPKGMDPKVVKTLHDAFKKGMEEPSYVEMTAKIDQEAVLPEHRGLSRLCGAHDCRAEAVDGRLRSCAEVIWGWPRSDLRKSDASESCGGAVQVVFVGALDLDGGDLADPQRPPARHIDRAVDFRCVAPGPAFGNRGTDFVDDDLLARADLALEPLLRDRLLARHEAVPALFGDVLGHSVGEVVRGRARDRLVAEAADAVERGLVEPFEQRLEILRRSRRGSRR